MTTGATPTPEEAALAILGPMVLQAFERSVGSLPGGSYASAKDALRDWARRDPLDANLTFILGASSLFFVAEKGANPKVNTFMDALVYVTTCLSVGYADVFARTEAGKLVGSIVMTVGPALSGLLLDPPAGKEDPNDAIQAAILEKLDAILAEMKRANEERPAT
jgi:hypothetical protein